MFGGRKWAPEQGHIAAVIEDKTKKWKYISMRQTTPAQEHSGNQCCFFTWTPSGRAEMAEK